MSDEAQPRRQMARVATVMDPYQVVINKGASDGIRVGQHYLFYALGDEIRDPETGDDLGQLEVLRGRGSVIHVQNKISIVRSSERRSRFQSAPMLSGIFPTNQTAWYEDLPFDGIAAGDFARPI